MIRAPFDPSGIVRLADGAATARRCVLQRGTRMMHARAFAAFGARRAVEAGAAPSPAAFPGSAG